MYTTTLSLNRVVSISRFKKAHVSTRTRSPLQVTGSGIKYRPPALSASLSSSERFTTPSEHSVGTIIKIALTNCTGLMLFQYTQTNNYNRNSIISILRGWNMHWLSHVCQANCPKGQDCEEACYEGKCSGSHLLVVSVEGLELGNLMKCM